MIATVSEAATDAAAAVASGSAIFSADTGACALCEWAPADFIDSARASKPAPMLAPAPSPTIPAEESDTEEASLALACSAGCMDSPDKSFADISASAASLVARGSGGAEGAAAAPDFVARSAARSACVGTAGFSDEDDDEDAEEEENDDDEEEDADEAAAADWMRWWRGEAAADACS